jgi:hypothetical protein
MAAAVCCGFDFHYLDLKSGTPPPFKRFAFELCNIIRRRPLSECGLFVELERH